MVCAADLVLRLAVFGHLEADAEARAFPIFRRRGIGHEHVDVVVAQRCILRSSTQLTVCRSHPVERQALAGELLGPRRLGSSRVTGCGRGQRVDCILSDGSAPSSKPSGRGDRSGGRCRHNRYTDSSCLRKARRNPTGRCRRSTCSTQPRSPRQRSWRTPTTSPTAVAADRTSPARCRWRPMSLRARDPCHL